MQNEAHIAQMQTHDTTLSNVVRNEVDVFFGNHDCLHVQSKDHCPPVLADFSGLVPASQARVQLNKMGSAVNRPYAASDFAGHRAWPTDNSLSPTRLSLAKPNYSHVACAAFNDAARDI